MMQSLFYLCNAFDDATRMERQVVTDSPAASRKIFAVTKAARSAHIRTWVVSMGRGRQNGSGRYFPGKVKRVGGVPVVYLPFIHFPLLSELLSLVAFVPLIWRFRRRLGQKTILLYNRFSAYLPALVLARVLGFDATLDLEDGATDINDRSLAGYKSRGMRWATDSLCSRGALLACDALAATTALRPTQSCYGTVEIQHGRGNWPDGKLHLLLGGTVGVDTGALWLLDAIEHMRKEGGDWAQDLIFDITGKGDSIDLFKAVSDDPRKPEVRLHGRTSNAEYETILANTQVGLSLRLNQGVLADTTFPSKVVEFASNDILVLTTDVSDVRKVFGDGAIFIEMNDTAHLVEKFRWIAENRSLARETAHRGMQAAAAVCAPTSVGSMLKKILFAPTNRSAA